MLGPAHPQTHRLTYATMHQDPREFIVDMGWKTSVLKNGWEKRPVVPIKPISIFRKEMNQAGDN